jgi:glycoside/pentoside/hexuronide:cation symporter, GPH family
VPMGLADPRSSKGDGGARYPTAGADIARGGARVGRLWDGGVELVTECGGGSWGTGGSGTMATGARDPAQPAWPTGGRRLPRSVKLLFGSGQGGSVIMERLIFTWLYFFWGHRGLEEGGPLIAPLVFGLLVFGGRVIDALTDPLVARWSDGHRGRLGRRRPFMLWSGIPYVIVAAVLFFPPAAGPSWVNTVYLGVGLAVFYVLLTLYLVPYAGLLADLSPHVEDRVDLATSNATYQLLGIAVAMIASPLLLEVAGPVVMVTVLAMLAVPLLYLPTLIDERRFARPQPATAPLVPAVRATLRNRPFVIALVATNVLWFGFNLVALNTPWYVTELVGLAQGAVALYSAVLLGVSLLLFPAVNAAAKRVGLRRVLLGALVSTGFVVPLLYLIPSPPFGLEPATFGLIVFALGGIGLSGLAIVPFAIIAAVADYDHHRTGQRREAMYFAVYFFVIKINFGISFVVSGALLQTFGSPLGIQVTGPIAGIAALAGAWLFRRYPEQDVLQAARREPAPPLS